LAQDNLGYCAYLSDELTDDNSLCLSYYAIGDDSPLTCMPSSISNGGECHVDSDCITESCNQTTNTCNKGDFLTSGCYNSSDCLTNNCRIEVQICSKSSPSNGGFCTAATADWCFSGLCNDNTNTCLLGGAGTMCQESSDCLSDDCSNQFCELSQLGLGCRSDQDCLGTLSCNMTTFVCQDDP